MPFVLSHLTSLLERCEQPVTRLWVAYSGGLDSHVLLHQLYQYRHELPAIAGAIHVNHGISAHAEAWGKHCQSICCSFGLDCVVESVELAEGEGLEDQARRARYRVFKQQLRTGDVLLLAQHQDDQAETFLLQAIRGGGPRGLAAMPAVSSLGQGCLIRPLLDHTRQDILHYAQVNQLHWIEDESNRDERFDRNYLRQTVMPVLQRRWPHIAQTLSRSARHTASLMHTTDELLHNELAGLLGSDDETLPIDTLLCVPKEKAALLIRAMCHRLNLPVPATVHIEELLSRQLNSHDEKQMRVSWPGGECRRYQGRLYLLPSGVKKTVSSDWSYEWDCKVPIILDELQLEISICLKPEKGISEHIIRQGLAIRPRSGGERCRAVGDSHSRDLKSIYQYHRIPPWERERIPLFYATEKLVAIGDVAVSDHARAGDNEAGYGICIKPLD